VNAPVAKNAASKEIALESMGSTAIGEAGVENICNGCAKHARLGFE
jgi:hypothetical protein